MIRDVAHREAGAAPAATGRHRPALPPGGGGGGGAGPGPGPRRRHRLLSTVLLLAALAACDDKEAARQPAQPGGPAPVVMVVAAERRPVARSQEFVGRVEALEKVEIRARVTGFLRRRHFEEGRLVREGDLLFTIEREPFEAEVAVKQARIESARAELANASLQVQRGRELVRTNALAQATLDQRLADQGTVTASLSGALADLRLAEINLGYTEIRSPIAGRIGRASVTPGNVVSPESGALTLVVRQDPIRVAFPISQRELLALRREYAGRAGADGVRVRIRLPDGSLYDQPGRLDFIDVVTDRGTDTVLVQAVVPNPADMLSDGQFVGVVLEEEAPRQVVVVPESAVQIDQAGPFLLVVGDGNRVEQRRVRLVRGPAGGMVVESGIEPGTLVITEGAQRARPGAAVTPRPPAAAAPGGAGAGAGAAIPAPRG